MASSALAAGTAPTVPASRSAAPVPSTGPSFPPDDLTPATPDEIRAFFAKRR